MKNHYKCPELGKTSFRPGAYDAFEIPSVYAGVRKPYRFSKEMKDDERKHARPSKKTL